MENREKYDYYVIVRVADRPDRACDVSEMYRNAAREHIVNNYESLARIVVDMPDAIYAGTDSEETMQEMRSDLQNLCDNLLNKSKFPAKQVIVEANPAQNQV